MHVAVPRPLTRPDGPAPDAVPHDRPGPCGTCGFELWVPVARLRVSRAGLYDDARFPGRSLLALDRHEEDLSALQEDELHAFMADLRDLSEAVKRVTGAPRVNVAVLGNVVPHLHWHVIPRRPDTEPLPGRSPWDDPRERRNLYPGLLGPLHEALRTELSPQGPAGPNRDGHRDGDPLAPPRTRAPRP